MITITPFLCHYLYLIRNKKSILLSTNSAIDYNSDATVDNKLLFIKAVKIGEKQVNANDNL